MNTSRSRFITCVFCFLALLSAHSAQACDREITISGYKQFEYGNGTLRIPALATPLEAAEQASASSEDGITRIFHEVLTSHRRHAGDDGPVFVPPSVAIIFSNGAGWRIRVSVVDERGTHVVVFRHRRQQDVLEFLPVDAWLQTSPQD